jgi:hypothetical protein
MPMDETSPQRSGRARRIGVSIAAAAVLVGSGIGIGVALTGGAAAASGSSNPAAAASTQPAGHCARAARTLLAGGHPAAAKLALGRCRFGLLRAAAKAGIHGEVTFKAKSGFRTLAFERGTVKSVSATAVTVQAADGTTWTWDVVKNTVVRQSGQTIAESRLAAGDQVLVAGQVVGGAKDASLIRIRPAA